MSDELRTVRKLVVFFDIRSSTTILEDLLNTENQRRWRNLLIGLKKFLMSEEPRLNFEIYKFLGDGWILLFDERTKGVKLMKWLDKLCQEYEELFTERVEDVLEASDYPVGLTFGADFGTLVCITMNRQCEYVGRALNVAARLQSSIGQKDDAPEGKLLISRNAFNALNWVNQPGIVANW